MVNNFRPLAMSSCVLKIFENMIKNRLDWIVENKKILSKYQMGFRKGKGIYDNIIYLTSYVQIALTKGDKIIGILLDIRNAYDNVNPYILYRILIQYNIDIDLANVILKILLNKQIFTKDKHGNILGPVISDIGIPQGSPLSPILFNLYVSDLIRNISENSKILSYADDILILIKGKSGQK